MEFDSSRAEVHGNEPEDTSSTFDAHENEERCFFCRIDTEHANEFNGESCCPHGLSLHGDSRTTCNSSDYMLGSAPFSPPGCIQTAGGDGATHSEEVDKVLRKKIQFFRRSQQSRTLAPVGPSGKVDGWKCLSIAVDSGACDNVIGPDDIPDYRDGIKETAESLRGDCFVSPSGEDIPNFGEVSIPLVTREHSLKAVKFQAAGVAKPLLSAEKMNQAGHIVILDGDGSCIVNKTTHEVTALRREEGNFMLDVWVPPAAVSRRMGFPWQP